MYTSLHSWFANSCFCAPPFPQITLLTIKKGTVSVIFCASSQSLQNSTDGLASVRMSIPLPPPLRDRSFFMSMGGLVGFRGGATRKKMALKGGATKKKWVKEGGVTRNNWLVGEIESGSTQKQMKTLNIISILFNAIFLTTFNLFYILRSKSAFYINNSWENEAYLLEKQ